MKIISTNIANLAEDKKQLYKLTKTKGMNVKDFESGTKAQVLAYCKYEDVNSKGTEQTVLAVITDIGKLQTISPTFIDAFDEVVDIMGNEDFSIIIVKDVSKGGREFVSCELVCD